MVALGRGGVSYERGTPVRRIRGRRVRGSQNRANMAHTRQSRPDSGFELSHFQCESLQNHLSCSLLAAGRGERRRGPPQGWESLKAGPDRLFRTP